MNDEQKVAYVYAQAVCAQIELQAMLAENQSRAIRGLAQAWGEEQLLELQDKYCISHNAVLGLFQQ